MTDDGLTTCLFIPSSLGESPKASPSSCGRCSTGMFSGRPTTPAASGCCRSRLRWHSGHGVTRHVRLGVHRVAEVATRLAQRVLLVHRDDREPAALVLAGVVDDGAAERLDQLVQVGVARVLAVDPEPVGRADDVAAVERPHAQVGQRALDLGLDHVEPDLLDQQPQEVLVGDALLVGQALGRQRLVDVRRGTPSCRPGAPGTRSARPGRSSRCSSSARRRPRSPAGRARRCARSACPRAPGCARRSRRRRSTRRGPARRARCPAAGPRRHRAVQLRGEAAAHAAGPVGDLHLFGLLSAGSCPPAALGLRVGLGRDSGSSSSPTTYRFSS